MSLWDTLRQWKRWIDALSPASWDDAFRCSLQSSPGVSVCYVGYRWVQFASHFLLMLGSIRETSNNHGNFEFRTIISHLSNWMFSADTSQAFTGCILATHRYFKVEPSETTTALMIKNTYSLMYQIATTFSVYTTFATGLTQFFSSSSNFIEYSPGVIMSWKMGMGTLLMIVDHLMVRLPYSLLSGVYTTVILIVYKLTLMSIGQNNTVTSAISSPLLASFFLSSVFIQVISFMLWGTYMFKREVICRNSHQERTRVQFRSGSLVESQNEEELEELGQDEEDEEHPAKDKIISEAPAGQKRKRKKTKAATPEGSAEPREEVDEGNSANGLRPNKSTVELPKSKKEK